MENELVDEINNINNTLKHYKVYKVKSVITNITNKYLCYIKNYYINVSLFMIFGIILKKIYFSLENPNINNFIGIYSSICILINIVLSKLNINDKYTYIENNISSKNELKQLLKIKQDNYKFLTGNYYENIK